LDSGCGINVAVDEDGLVQAGKCHGTAQISHCEVVIEAGAPKIEHFPLRFSDRARQQLVQSEAHEVIVAWLLSGRQQVFPRVFPSQHQFLK
jgi:hypothetical protein